MDRVSPFYFAQDVKLYNDLSDLNDAYNSFLEWKNSTVNIDMWKSIF